jgi:peptidoglycan/LPS O-acetylase OafA/YrhL
MKLLQQENNFDLFRLLLAFLVFFAHWNILTAHNFTNRLFHLSGYAVDMFFIVSGFLIFMSFDNDQNKKHFFIKRFFRIFPLYAFLILLQTLFFIGFSDGSLFEIVKYFVVNIFYLNFLSLSVGSTFSSLEVNAINGSLWTLKNEVLFYLAVPAIFSIYKRFYIYGLLALYFLSASYIFLVTHLGMPKLEVQFPSQLRLFIVGILFYVLFFKMDKKKIFTASAFSLLSILLFEKNTLFHSFFEPFALGTVMIFIVYHLKHLKLNFDFSYSFYILHFPVIQLFLFFKIDPNDLFLSFITLFCTVLVLSYIAEKYIEKRFIQIGRDLIKREKNDSN